MISETFAIDKWNSKQKPDLLDVAPSCSVAPCPRIHLGMAAMGAMRAMRPTPRPTPPTTLSLTLVPVVNLCLRGRKTISLLKSNCTLEANSDTIKDSLFDGNYILNSQLVFYKINHVPCQCMPDTGCSHFFPSKVCFSPSSCNGSSPAQAAS